ncbi:rRNA maturation RNase YbeY [Candidatus Collierbacteria bacterium]|nr:rRNA maturation RNase YbeY [Candidatus Collierbacteria bacterium]
MKIDIFGDSRYPVDRKYIRTEVILLLKEFGFDQVDQVLVEITVVGNRKIKELNNKFRKLDEKTDVLSFPLEDRNPSPDGFIRLGDIAVSFPEAMTMAIRTNRIVDKVIAELICHGVRHLMGEHHE